jgi:glycosyltransferase involved in cell wall biosynthesis
MWARLLGSSRGRGEPLPPGPRGAILYVAALNGGIGGAERLTKTFAAWVEASGYSATLVFRQRLDPGPFSVQDAPRLRVLSDRDWSPALEHAPWRHVYVVPPGLDRRRWAPRLGRLAGTRILLHLDQARHYVHAADLIHCETPPEADLPLPFVVATPDPHPTLPEVPETATEDFDLTVFTPYGRVKGHPLITAFLQGTGRRLVWCYDVTSFAGRKRRYAREIRERVASVASPLLDAREGLPRAEIYRLYRAARGYVCFSEREGLGWALVDALALGKPVASRRVGICRLIPGFEATTDFARPVFRTWPLPETPGFARLFAEAEHVVRGS